MPLLLDGGVNSSGGSDVCGLPGNTRFHPFSHGRREKEAILYLLHCEVDFYALTIQMLRKACRGLLSVISAQSPAFRCCPRLMTGGTHGHTFNLLIEVNSRLEVGCGETQSDKRHNVGWQ